MGGFETLYKYIHSGDLEELDDVVPYEDHRPDYTAEDFIQDHAVITVGDSEDAKADPFYCPEKEVNDEEGEPTSAKRFKTDFDSYDNDESNDFDVRLGITSEPGIPSLLNLNLEPPRAGQDTKNVSQKSPTASPWESSNHSNGALPASKDRRTRGSRWR